MTTPLIDPERSRIMRAVKGKDTAPEMAVRRFLWNAGLRYRLHDKKLPGKPDIVFRAKRIAVFIHGCFWHGHEGCSRHRIPKTHTDYWAAKISRNKERDACTAAALRAMGWTVLVLWECEIKRPEHLSALLTAIKSG